jgi:hypothetical protein
MTNLGDWLRDPDQEGTAAGILPEYLFWYVGPAGLAYTVGYRHIRMNSYSRMNDPRESQSWTASGVAAEPPFTDADMRKRIDDVFRGGARLMALCADQPAQDDATKPHLFHRGWARPAMWAHYSSAHEGVCMVFETTELIESIFNLPTRDGRWTSWGSVTYRDEPIDLDIPGV